MNYNGNKQFRGDLINRVFREMNMCVNAN